MARVVSCRFNGADADAIFIHRGWATAPARSVRDGPQPPVRRAANKIPTKKHRREISRECARPRCPSARSRADAAGRHPGRFHPPPPPTETNQIRQVHPQRRVRRVHHALRERLARKRFGRPPHRRVPQARRRQAPLDVAIFGQQPLPLRVRVLQQPPAGVHLARRGEAPAGGRGRDANWAASAPGESAGGPRRRSRRSRWRLRGNTGVGCGPPARSSRGPPRAEPAVAISARGRAARSARRGV